MFWWNFIHVKTALAWLFIPSVALAFYVGVRLGRESDQDPGSEELRIIAINLEERAPELSPQMREYFKGRVYNLMARGVRSDWVNGRVDYGPIDRNALGTIVVDKGPDTDEDLYRFAMKAAGKTQSTR